jgi:hypothetical protein
VEEMIDEFEIIAFIIVAGILLFSDIGDEL